MTWVDRQAIQKVNMQTFGVTLSFAFPGRRYHATPWGHHVNEGLIEWPPSPWRLLRALLATGYTKLHWNSAAPPAPARALLAKLASEAPRYRLPEAIATHSRHYMPLGRFDNGREQTTMVLDTWAQIDDDSIGVHWNIALTAEEREVLATLVREMGYLGRSESWVEGRLLDAANIDEFDVFSGEFRDRPGAGWEQVALLAPVPETTYQAWREGAVVEAIAGLPEVDAKGRSLSAARRKVLREELLTSYPVDLIECLLMETSRLQAFGWSQPPGSRKLLYWRRSDSLEATARRAVARPDRSLPVEFMLLALSPMSGNLHALPNVTRALPQGELLHRAILSRCGEDGEHVVALSGKDSNGEPLRGDQSHQHAHLIYLDLDADQHLDHVLIWTPMGLDAAAQRVIRRVRRTFTKGGVDPLRLALVAQGNRRDLARLGTPFGDRLKTLLGDDGLVTWRSVTPFVPPRFLKARGKNSLEGQIAAELQNRGIPEPDSIRVLDPQSPLVRAARHFVKCRARRKGATAAPPVDVGFMLELTFARPIIGPLAIGYGSHFGLGVLARVDEG